MLSLGADLYAGDPISHFTVARDDFAALGARLAATRLTIVTVMEGVYATAELGDHVAAFVAGLHRDA